MVASNEEPPKRPATQTDDIADIQSRELSTSDKYWIFKTQLNPEVNYQRAAMAIHSSFTNSHDWCIVRRRMLDIVSHVSSSPLAGITVQNQECLLLDQVAHPSNTSHMPTACRCTYAVMPLKCGRG